MPPNLPAESSFLTAVNYAPASSNAIHRDDFARQYGFTGGLVPGVGVYALMADPLLRAWGAEWADAGWMKAKFINPVYDGERVEIRCRPLPDRPAATAIEALNPTGRVCALGSAGCDRDDSPLPDPADFDTRPVPTPEDRLPPAAAFLTPGLRLGSVPVAPDPASPEDAYFERLREDRELCLGGAARLHPAFLAHIANRVVHRNIAVGPWIHTESFVRHLAPLRHGSSYEMRGRVAESFQKRGHEYVRLDLAVFDSADNPVAHLLHTAIVRPALARA
jgi:acyl dehydratase